MNDIHICRNDLSEQMILTQKKKKHIETAIM